MTSVADRMASIPVGGTMQVRPPQPGAYEEELEDIRPHDGPQTAFLSCTADICVYGGAAGGGKTRGLLMDPLRAINIPAFRAIIFRRTYPQITNPGGLWDESELLYPAQGGVPTKSIVTWTFPSGARIAFKHMQHEKSKEEFQGAQIPFIGFDELTHFTRGQFFYMLSRNRSTCGVIPYVRATCNPDANSWVKVFLAPWLDRKFVQPNGEKRTLRSGEIGYFSQVDGIFKWHSQETYERENRELEPQDRTIKTVTFIKSTVFDNKTLLRTNPQYLQNLRALPLVEQERFLGGNWDIVESGNMFRREWFKEINRSELPLRFRRLIRFWDFASTKPGEVERNRKEDDPDYTAGALLGLGYDGRYYFIDLVLEQMTPKEIDDLVLKTALMDFMEFGANYEVWMEQEPGSNAEIAVEHIKQLLAGFYFEGHKATGSKIARAKPLSSECQKGNVYVVMGGWPVDDFYGMATAFPNADVHDDPVDAISGAFTIINLPPAKPVYKPIMAGAVMAR
jgi:predicted phage terminase large subunit-like protein